MLPELATSGYEFESLEEVASVAITPDHPLFADSAAEASRGSVIVVGGFCEEGNGARFYNSAAIVDGSGVRGIHRKTHLWDREKLFFQPGMEVPRLFDTAVGRIGILICYELEFPELTRMLPFEGAELVVVPTNWPLVDRPAGERPPEVNIAMASARVNRVYIACCDRTGTERGHQWTAGTTIIDYSGWVITSQTEVGPAVCEIEPALARDKKLTDLCDALGDRRPDLYTRSPARQWHRRQAVAA